MKNMLLDWHSKSGNHRKQVMLVISSLLHFTDAEKGKFGLSGGPNDSGVVGAIVGAVASPIGASKVNVDKLEGENVRDKFVNFLMSESADDDF